MKGTGCVRRSAYTFVRELSCDDGWCETDEQRFTQRVADFVAERLAALKCVHSCFGNDD